jgi:repressor LexA
MTTLTKKQHDVLKYIEEYLEAHHYAPSYREIMQHFSFTSLGTVYRYIQVLKTKGLLSAKKKSSRSISLLQKSNLKDLSAELNISLIGSISAGEALEIFPKSQMFTVPRSLIALPDATYVLQVKGDGLMEELIADGDYLLVEARQEAESGETIVAFLHQTEVIVKKYYYEEVYIRLTSHNPQSHPLIVHEDDLFIQGVVVGVIRKMK